MSQKSKRFNRSLLLKNNLTKYTNVLYYKGNQKEVNMITILIMLFACSEEKANDSAVPAEQEETAEE